MTYKQLLASYPDFRRLWIGQVVSEIGDWLNNIAVFALVIHLAGTAHEGRAVAFYSLARHVPLFLFGPIAGVIVDRFDRRLVMIAADILRALLTIGFFVADACNSLALIYLTGACLFVVSPFFSAAKRAAIPVIVPESGALLAANALSASTTAATIAVGSALGGIVATVAGRSTVFALNIASFIISALVIRRIQINTNAFDEAKHELIPEQNSEVITSETGATLAKHSLREGSLQSVSTFKSKMSSAIVRGGGKLVSDFREGVSYVRRDAMLSLIFLVGAGWGLGNGAARALYSIFGARLGAAQVGWSERPEDFGISVLFVAMGIGGVLGAPLARRFNLRASFDLHRLGGRMGASMMLDGFALALFSFMPTLWSAAGVLVLRELNYAMWWTAQQTLIMRRTDAMFGGRVFASFETLTTLAMVASMLLSGTAADLAGIRPVACAGGIIILLSGILWFGLRRRSVLA